MGGGGRGEGGLEVGFQVSHFYWPFSSDTAAVKGFSCGAGYTSCWALVCSPPHENVLMQQWSTLYSV